MRDFNYGEIGENLRTNEVCNLISSLHEFRGKQALFMSAKPDVLSSLLEVAKIQSTAASNSIEGISTTDVRLKALMAEKTEPRNRNEEEIAGYRDVLAIVHESHDVIPITPNTILQLHRDLCRRMAQNALGGHWKHSENIISETDATGRSRIRFRPLSAFETPDGMERLCATFREARARGIYDELLLIPLFILDFLCIHPFTDGNGRMSRILSLLLLYQAGYVVGKYISMEMMIEKSKEAYYEALRASSQGWLEGVNDPVPFIKYFLGLALSCYRLFEERVEDVLLPTVSKPERIRKVIDRTIGRFTKSSIAEACPDISETTIERTLRQFQAEGYIRKLGGGRGTAYAKRL